MKKVKYCFVVLTYNGFGDFKNFYHSLENIEEDFAVILVDSFSSEHTSKEGELLAKKLNIDFISVPNRGYGAGNNIGIKFAKKHYDFEYVIISNPDTTIESMNYDTIAKYGQKVIIGPNIKNLNGKEQNPLYFKRYKLPFWILSLYIKKGAMYLLYIYLVFNKLYSLFFRLKNRQRESIEVYALHGSFMIIGNKALSVLAPLYDERMFLYAEENHVAEQAKALNISLFLDKSLVVNHKENGSTGENSINSTQIQNTLNSLRVFFKNKY